MGERPSARARTQNKDQQAKPVGDRKQNNNFPEKRVTQKKHTGSLPKSTTRGTPAAAVGTERTPEAERGGAWDWRGCCWRWLAVLRKTWRWLQQNFQQENVETRTSEERGEGTRERRLGAAPFWSWHERVCPKGEPTPRPPVAREAQSLSSREALHFFSTGALRNVG